MNTPSNDQPQPRGVPQEAERATPPADIDSSSVAPLEEDASFDTEAAQDSKVAASDSIDVLDVDDDSPS